MIASAALTTGRAPMVSRTLSGIGETKRGIVLNNGFFETLDHREIVTYPREVKVDWHRL